jgi:hypothetical protein
LLAFVLAVADARRNSYFSRAQELFAETLDKAKDEV